MARISDDDIAKVREATDVVSVVADRVVLRQKGRIFWGLCPFHQEKSPSFKVDPTTQLWHCFGCGEGGDVFKFLMKTESLDFPEAVKVLADRARIDIVYDEAGAGSGSKSQRLREVCQATADFYNSVLRQSRTPGAQSARSYLAGRGFGSEIAGVWNLGYAPGRGQLVAHLRALGFADREMVEANVAVGGDRGAVRDRFYERVMFPITDLTGRTIAFGGRILDPKGSPKYLNSNDTPIFHKSANVYGLHLAKPKIIESKTALVVEGYTDVIALHAAGFSNAVATLGTALTDRHVKLLSRLANRVVYVFDGDEAGLRAADRAVEFIDETITPESSSSPVILDVVVLPNGVDPAELVAQQGGADKMSELLGHATPLVSFAIDRRLDRWDLSRPEQAQQALKDAAGVLAPIRGSVMATGYAQRIVDRMWAAGAHVELNQVLKAIESSSAPSVRRASGVEGAAEQPPMMAPAAVTSAEDRLASQLIALLVAKPDVRAELAQVVATSEMGRPEVVAVARTLVGDALDASPTEAVALVKSGAPAIAYTLSEYHFAGLTREAAVGFGRELVDRLNELTLQRRVRELIAEMRGSTDKERYTVEISALQLQLDQLRAARS